VEPVVVLLHIGAGLGPEYASPLGASWRSFVEGAGSGSYDEKTGLAARYPTLESFLRAEVPEWAPGAPLVLAAWSAGCWAPRAWMRQQASRSIVSALVLLDGLHSGFDDDGRCKLSAVDGICWYGQDAADWPGRHCLVLTHTEIVPESYASTEQCAELVDLEVPPSPSVHIVGYPGDDADAHLRQVQQVGPSVMRSIVSAQLRGTPTSSLKAAGIAVAAFGLLAAAGILLVR
jgi:hypothetical protein